MLRYDWWIIWICAVDLICEWTTERQPQENMDLRIKNVDRWLSSSVYKDYFLYLDRINVTETGWAKAGTRTQFLFRSTRKGKIRVLLITMINSLLHIFLLVH
jgi:hypothetical protein